MVQDVNKVREKFYARKKVLPFILNPPLVWQPGIDLFHSRLDSKIGLSDSSTSLTFAIYACRLV